MTESVNMAGPTGIAVPISPKTGKAMEMQGRETLWRIIEYKQRMPDATHEEIAQALGLTRVHVTRYLNTDYAKARIEQHYDLAPYIAQGLRSAAANAVEFVDLAPRRGVEELRKPKPNAHVLASATQSAKAVLAGTGVLQEHIRLEQLPTDDAAKLLEQLLQDNGEGETGSTG